MNVLVRNQHQTVTYDDYGNRDDEKYWNKIGYFIDKMISEELNEIELKAIHIVPIRARLMAAYL
jgi:hypothetical protein